MVEPHFGTPETHAPTLGLDQILCIRQSDGSRFSELVYALIEAGAVTIRGGVIEVAAARQPKAMGGWTVAVPLRVGPSVTLGDLRALLSLLEGAPDHQEVDIRPSDAHHELRVRVGEGW